MTSREGQTRDLNTLRAQYLDSWRCYLAIIASAHSAVRQYSRLHTSDSLASCLFCLSRL